MVDPLFNFLDHEYNRRRTANDAVRPEKHIKTEGYAHSVRARPVHTTLEFSVINRWCFDTVGETGWGYQGWQFYFDAPEHAFAFKMRWG